MAFDGFRTNLARTVAIAALALSFATMVAPSTAAAKTDRREVAGGEYRELNGHQFVTPLYVKSAFNNAYFSFAQGFGMYKFKLLDKTSSLFMYYQQFGGQFDIMNWVSIELGANGFAAIAGDLEDILTLGAIANVDAAAFIRGRFFTLEDIGLQMSGGVGIGYSRLLNMRPIVLAQNAVAALSGDTSIEDQLVVTFQSVAVSPTVMLAYGNGPFGAQLSIGADIDISLDKGGENGYSLRPGLHVGFDIGHFTEYFPFALVVEYMANANVGAGGGVGHSVAGGLEFSGRRDVNLGVLIGAEPNTDSLLLFGALNMQYYF